MVLIPPTPSVLDSKVLEIGSEGNGVKKPRLCPSLLPPLLAFLTIGTNYIEPMSNYLNTLENMDYLCLNVPGEKAIPIAIVLVSSWDMDLEIIF